MIQKSRKQNLFTEPYRGPVIEATRQNRMIWCKRCGEAVGIYDMTSQ